MPTNMLTPELRLSQIHHVSDLDYDSDFAYDQTIDISEEIPTATPNTETTESEETSCPAEQINLSPLIVEDEWIEIGNFLTDEEDEEAHARIFTDLLTRHHELLKLEDKQERKELEIDSDALSRELESTKLWDKFYENGGHDNQAYLNVEAESTEESALLDFLERRHEKQKNEVALNLEYVAKYQAEQVVDEIEISQKYLTEYYKTQEETQDRDYLTTSKAFDFKAQREDDRALSLRRDKSHPLPATKKENLSERDALKSILFVQNKSLSKKRIADVMHLHSKEAKSDKNFPKFFDRHVRVQHSRQNEKLLEAAKKEMDSGAASDLQENSFVPLNCKSR